MKRREFLLKVGMGANIIFCVPLVVDFLISKNNGVGFMHQIRNPNPGDIEVGDHVVCWYSGPDGTRWWYLEQLEEAEKRYRSGFARYYGERSFMRIEKYK